MRLNINIINLPLCKRISNEKINNGKTEKYTIITGLKQY